LKKQKYMELNEKNIQKLDSENVLGSIDLVPKQAAQAWQEARRVKVPESYKKVSRAVVVGMGGSAIGPHLVRSVLYDKFYVPVQIVNGYNLPAYTDEDTLVLLSSYSGTTEEVLSCAREAKAKRAKVMVIAGGGNLADLAKKNRWPAYIFTATYNPCNQPRVGMGYAIFGTMALLSRAGVVRISDAEATLMIKKLVTYVRKFRFKSPASKNDAKKLSQKLKNKNIFLVGSEFLEGNMHIMSNQINETSKQFATWFMLPEINHHLLEGLSFPNRPKKDMIFLFFESMKYHPQVQKRYPITKQIVIKNKIGVVSYKLNERTKLGQAAEILMLGAYVSFYMGMLNGQDPAFIPWVKYLKNKL
jgi:glucose/mannose-6-phosphate isomerase